MDCALVWSDHLRACAGKQVLMLGKEDNQVSHGRYYSTSTLFLTAGDLTLVHGIAHVHFSFLIHHACDRPGLAWHIVTIHSLHRHVSKSTVGPPGRWSIHQEWAACVDMTMT